MPTEFGSFEESAGVIPRRLCFLNAGFLWDRRLRRILELAGHDLRLGLPRPGDGVVVWGRSPYARRGEHVARMRNAPLIRLEDAFVRSIRPGRAGDPTMGLLIDPIGVHFDSAAPSLLEQILAKDNLDDSNILARARDGIARLRHHDISKYNIHDPSLPVPKPGYVLVVDQTAGDASIHHGGASAAQFAQMLAAAQDDHPGAHIVIKTHPETALGLRSGHFAPAQGSERITVLAAPVSPWQLVEGAIAVYTVSSHLGFEAIMAGHRPKVFGQPFYAGWGLTDDQLPIARRGRKLTRAQLFAAAMILAPVWYDPCRDRLCSFEEAIDQLEAELRSHREDRCGYVAVSMRLWKRPRLQQVFGRQKPLIFRSRLTDGLATAASRGRNLLVWAGKDQPEETVPAGLTLRRVEDGFLRSRGLGAELVPPLSLVADDLGIYYDPMRESRLERLILSPLLPGGKQRAERLRERLIASGLSKYNLAGAMPEIPQAPWILVPGQVEDDQSILKGAGEIRTNLDLLRATRAARPDTMIVFKPHPDVEAGLRPGRISQTDLQGLADFVAEQADPVALITACTEVWTITSLMGFEALIRGKPVTCLGTPFYSGWGLTHDLGRVPDRRVFAPDGSRRPRPSLDQIVHAALIAYPRYFDPVSGRPCPPETVIDRLTTGILPKPGAGNRALSKLQGLFASQAWLWRRQ